MLTIRCPCGEEFHAAEEHVGRQLRCRRCGVLLTVNSATPRSLDGRDALASSEVGPPAADAAGVNGPPWSAARARSRWRGVWRFVTLGLAGSTAMLAVALLLRSSSPSGFPLPISPSHHSHPTAAAAPPVMQFEGDLATTTHPSSVPAGRRAVPAAPSPHPPACAPDRRPENGAALVLSSEPGDGVLAVTNGNGSDGVVSLVDYQTGRIVRSSYVRGNATARMGAIRPGSYTVGFALVSGYSTSGHKFCTLGFGTEFEKPFDFQEDTLGNEVRYVIEEITLNPVIDGNAHTHPVAASTVLPDSLPL